MARVIKNRNNNNNNNNNNNKIIFKIIYVLTQQPEGQLKKIDKQLLKELNKICLSRTQEMGSVCVGDIY